MSAVLSPMPPLECSCGAAHFERVHLYEAPPEGETRFPFSAGAYRRTIERCRECAHYVTRHAMDTSGLYDGTYVDAVYGDADGIRRTFERIVDLPEHRSDNAGRVRRIMEFTGGRTGSILDVGSGLCVFLHRMKAAGWDCTALDPDARACEHARRTVGVRAVHGDFMRVTGLGRFDAISLNKVLEHVPEPVAMLRRAASHLVPNGFVYVEVPDGEHACADGLGRQEFFIDHLHVFSARSCALMVERAGFRLALPVEQVREPSGKYTLRAFAVLRQGE